MKMKKLGRKTIIIFILVILVLVFLIGPKLIDTITNIVNTVPESVESLRKLLQDTNINWDWVQDYLASIEIDWQSISNKVLSFFKTLLVVYLLLRLE